MPQQTVIEIHFFLVCSNREVLYWKLLFRQGSVCIRFNHHCLQVYRMAHDPSGVFYDFLHLGTVAHRLLHGLRIHEDHLPRHRPWSSARNCLPSCTFADGIVLLNLVQSTFLLWERWADSRLAALRSLLRRHKFEAKIGFVSNSKALKRWRLPHVSFRLCRNNLFRSGTSSFTCKVLTEVTTIKNTVRGLIHKILNAPCIPPLR